ncbi:MAG: class I SAM-dependent DNA methyltransferase, partial [Oceanospirillaceae bacterium]|nr:class I SAM-dependent DNA methyltransferase [Oceanospirillaceae bacterium]
PSPITGEPVPDESAQVEQYRYINPRKAEWPQADYIVGNPPFIGASTMRRALGDGYVDAVRNTWKELPESADFVMHWWHIAAETVRAGAAKQFGFITTNSIKQTFNRRVVQAQLEAKNPLTLAFAIPDHPWVDAADGAAVRIAMTTGSSSAAPGRLLQVREESAAENAQDEIEVKLAEQQGVLFADLKTGANVAAAKPLLACQNISQRGFELGNAGFIVTDADIRENGLDKFRSNTYPLPLREYRNGRDLTDKPRMVKVIDLHGLSEDEVLKKFPEIFQWLMARVKPERILNRDIRLQKYWWLHRRSRTDLRLMLDGLPRYIATVETMKHRIFQFLSMDILPDNKLVNIALDDASKLGIVSSRLHTLWALAAGSRLGVGNDSVYVKTTCFETFPFPDATPEQQEKIRTLAERLDAHRKQQQAQFPELTLTGMYNVLEKIRSGDVLTDKEKVIHQQGLVSVLREIHDELDRAVFAAYGWDDLADKLVGLPGATTPLPDKPDVQAAAEEELLQRLVALNAQRAAEEANGYIRWLRPEYQNPNQNQQTGSATAPQQTEADLAIDDNDTPVEKTKAAKKPAWPKNMREQVAAVRAALAIGDLSATAIAQQFNGKAEKHVESVLAALEELGIVVQEQGIYRLLG